MESNDHKAKKIAWNRKYKNQVLDKCGNACVVCKENRIEFLTIDHIKGNGSKERKLKHNSCSYVEIQNMSVEEVREKYQTLCYNCNFIKLIGHINQIVEDRQYSVGPRAKEQRIRRAKKKRQVVDHYGGKCECCGEDRIDALSVEHKNGGGRKHRQEIGANNILHWIIKNNFPADIGILCHNCNCAKGKFGCCPHKN